MSTSVLFINCPNRLTRDPEFFPYGLGLLTSVMEKQGCHVEIYDLNINRSEIDFLNYINNNPKWDIIGVSGLVTTYSYQLKLAQTIRQLCPDSLLISGGGLASAVPEYLLLTTCFDISIIGEGEHILVEVLKRIASKDFSDVAGIAWKREDTVILNNAAKPIEDLDSIPFPNWDKSRLSDYFQFSGLNYKGIAASKLTRRGDLSTTRGCPYHCTFCFNVFCRSKIRSRSVDNIMSEITELIDRYNIDSIDFLDENFCYSRERVIELCTKLINSGFDLKWGTAARVDNIDKDLLLLMKDAGCIFILYGFESGSQTILDHMNKKISIEQSWHTFELTESVGIDARGNLMIGHPGETAETLTESLEFQKKRYNYLMRKYKDYSNKDEFYDDMKKRFSTVSLCTPYPGTQIYNDNRDQIGDLGEFLCNISLSDAKKFVVNISELSTVDLLKYQGLLSSPDKWFK